MHLLRQSASQPAIRSIFLSGLYLTVLFVFSSGSSAADIVTNHATINSALDPLNAPSPTTMEAQATTTVSMSGNLSAGQPVKTFSINDPINTSSFSTGFQLFDSLGFGHAVTMYFNKTSAANNTWQYNIVGAASEFTVVSASTSSDGLSDLIATGTLDFTNGGLLDTEGTPSYYNSATPTGLTFTNGAANMLTADLTFSFGTSITTDGGAGTDGMLQQGGHSVLLSLSQDGYANGVLVGVSTDETTGKIIGRFSNGIIRELGQLQPTIFDIPGTKEDDGNNTPNSTTIQAEQSGLWTVGQLGTWHVKIDSTQDNPMAVLDMANAQKSPWAKSTKFQIEDGQTNTNALNLNTPQSQRLVIEHISLMSTYVGQVNGRTDLNMSATIQVMLHDQPIIHHIGISDNVVTKRQNSQLVKHVMSKPYRIYADPGTQIKLNIERNYYNQAQNGTISLSGYVEPVF